MNYKYSKWSAILSLYCGIAMASSYYFAPDKPEGIIVPILFFLFYSAIIAGIVGLLFTILAFNKREAGYLKMVGPVALSIVVLVFLISFVGIMFIGED
ncbi:hypothetical protein [Paucisalibacillus sp. EB02]|uniref:hypothetical protein n=1 Tax=Paucisalibacillus sp. EB02 TaxID=1347087 RepID=UPI0005A95D33|nr:hypothetical protein [Paucisalibacillus sp. EB02]